MPDGGVSLLGPDGTAYARTGRGRPLILVHGVGMNAGFWAPQRAVFEGERDVVAYDMLGHGGSRLPPDPAALADYAAQLRRLMDHLGIAHATVVGHSMGALVALEFALTYPGRVDAVAAMNAVYRRTAAQRAAVARRAAGIETGLSEEGRRQTLARWFGDPVPEAQRGTAAWVDAALAAVEPAGYARTYRLFATSDEAHAGRLPALAMPALFLTGEHDANSAPAMARAMAAEAPKGRAMVIPGARHMMSLVSPALVNAALRDFLAGD